jgi:hypothetical protein
MDWQLLNTYNKNKLVGFLLIINARLIAVLSW